MERRHLNPSFAAVLGAVLVPLLLAAPWAVAQTTVVVPPSGGDDTAALAAAFDAASAAGPGSTVELLAGVYRVSEPILIRSFSGTWHGAGIGETVVEIEGAGGAPFPLTSFGPLDPAFPGDPPFDGRPAVFVLTEVLGGAPTDLNLSDLSFWIRGESERWSIWNTIADLFWVLPKRGPFGPPDRTTASFRADRVEVTGELISNLPFFGVIENLFNFVEASGTPGGNELEMALRITRSRFELCDRMVILTGLVDSAITIGGLPPYANRFEAGTNAFNFINLEGSTVEVAHNLVNTHVFAFVQHFQGPAPASDYHFHHNAVDAAFYTDSWPSAAIWIVDFAVFSGGRSANVVIEHNDFDFAQETPFGLEDGPGLFYGPLNALIEGVISAGVVVRENRISGPFDEAAIELGVAHLLHPAWPNLEASVIGNNVEQVEAGVAPIWLGPASADSTVQGNPNQVLDQGTGNDVSGQ